MTESININSLTDHHIWSTIKTLPATLPEPKFRVSRANALQHSDWNLRPRILEPGVTEGVSESDLDLIRGGGAAGRRGLRLREPVYLIGW